MGGSDFPDCQLILIVALIFYPYLFTELPIEKKKILLKNNL